MYELRVDAGPETTAILAVASNEARRLGEWHIAPAHLLAALAGYPQGKASTLLASHGVTDDSVRRLCVLREPRLLIDAEDDDVLAWLGIDAGAVRERLWSELSVDPFDPAPDVHGRRALDPAAMVLLDHATDLTDRLNLPQPQGSLHLLAALLTHRYGSLPVLLVHKLGCDVGQLRVEAFRALGVARGDLEALVRGLDGLPDDPLAYLEVPGASAYLDEDAAARAHALDSDTPRAVRAARILYWLGAAVEDAAALRARKHGWSEADIDRILHRVHVLEQQIAIQLAFNRAVAAEDEIDERLRDLVTRGTPLAFTRPDVRARIEEYLLNAGFSLVDAARGERRGWTFAEPALLQAAIFGAGVEGEPATISIGSGPFPDLPPWSNTACDRMLERASQLATALEIAKPRGREVFETVHDSAVLIRMGGTVQTVNATSAPSDG